MIPGFEGEESHHFHLYRLPEGKTFGDYRDEHLVPRDSLRRALDAGTMDWAEAREVDARLVSDWTRGRYVWEWGYWDEDHSGVEFTVE